MSDNEECVCGSIQFVDLESGELCCLECHAIMNISQVKYVDHEGEEHDRRISHSKRLHLYRKNPNPTNGGG